MAKTPHEMMAAVTASMKARTGRSVDEWVALIRATGPSPSDQGAVRRWLKTTHGIPQNSQWAIADAAARAAGWVRPSDTDYVDSQYAGAKAHLRPVFDRLRVIMETFGPDVKMEGRSTYTPFVRARQFVAIAAATRDRVDVGLRYTNAPASPLLAPAKAPGQATHKIGLRHIDDITPRVEKLLRVAYDQNG